MSKKNVQCFMQSIKLNHSLDTTRTNVHFHFGAAREIQLCGHITGIANRRSSRNNSRSVITGMRINIVFRLTGVVVME